MLIEFSVENFRSFSELQHFSMVASADDARSESLISCEKFDLSRSAAIFGANASGKSNLLKAISVMRDFIESSATSMNVGDRIPGMVPFRLDKKWRNKPCSFQITVLIKGTRYEYSLSADSKRVHSESLFTYKPKGRRSKKFTRRLDHKTGKTKWDIAGVGKKDNAFLRDKTRDNGLLLSRAAELNFDDEKELYLWFSQALWCLDLSSAPEVLIQTTAQKILKNQSFKRRVLAAVRDADLGISGVDAELTPVQFPKDMPENIKKAFTDAIPKGFQFHSVVTTHFGTDKEPVKFHLEHDESNGTQRFFAIVGPVLSALEFGKIIVCDELDCSMHPSLTRKIVELFQNPVANPKGGQLIFATHDSSLLNSALFRRDQIWITKKKQNGSTELYSLYDFRGTDKPRKDEAFQRQYLSGSYGGVPSFGPIFEDLELP